MAEGDQQRSEELVVILNELAMRMERLKQLYEQYFMGIERLEPMVARKEVTRSMLGLQQQYIRNTGLRFKFNTMLQKWNVYTTYWNRTLREIESGTYVRHLQKAARAAAEKGKALPSEMKLRQPGGVEGAVGESSSVVPEATVPDVHKLVPPPGLAAKPTPAAGKAPPPLPPSAKPPAIPGAKPPPPVPTAARPPVAAPPRPASTGPVPGMNETELRALHKKYVEARASAGDTAPVRYESLVASLAKQVPKVLEQPGVRGVKFDVSVQGGKAVLKAIPTK